MIVMVQNKDASFKFISKDHLKELFDILDFHLDFDIDSLDVEVLPTEVVAIEPSLVRPDYIIRIKNIIFMMEFESSHVGLKKKKLFKLYIASYDYKNNDENDSIIFFVVSTKEKSKMAEYSINDWDSFKFPIISLRELDKEKIINNIETKMDNKDTFTNRELIELALTPILEKDKENVIDQFYETKEIMSKIHYPTDEIKTSVYGIVLMLSSMYFDELDPIRKYIQGDLMGKVDCVAEACNKSFEEGHSEGYSEGHSEGYSEGEDMIVRNVLINSDLSVEEISRISGVSLDKVVDLKNKL